ncbi:NAD(P)-dependent oxidoreductase [Achromobacter sp. MY14]|uniref:NAD-dependent epimerase/dehydratase family protein n=1 Tax=Achromobacter TaxID=222 RepID=UPI000F8FBD0E|nr:MULTISPECIES: NAD(P)-dependent oxidoreductase [Achromobacter]AZS82277.1 NAD(P)-dependent oxidoreductase [Achromobacter spanius]MCD0496483.1 NAD(P)-dependent oxidoreductase [Achromobacter sp. MY14]
MADGRRVAVLGGSSLVGQAVLPLLAASGWHACVYSRRPRPSGLDVTGIPWRLMPPVLASDEAQIPWWLCLAPIWTLPQYFAALEACGARRVVALSSTSRFTKIDSSDDEENAVAQRLTQAEEQVRQWAERRNIEWVILRPTLIYGFGQDKNVSEIARLIQRTTLFPLLGPAQGLRQPVHALDIASACVAALTSPAAADQAYNLSGGETLPYRQMVARIFEALGRPVRMIAIPLFMFRIAVCLARVLPRFRKWSPAMAERMNRDMVFDYTAARQDLGFRPRPFHLSPNDIPA